MFDDRLEIYSPGGMADGTMIQERNIDNVPSTRSNPIIAEIFHRLDYIERRGSGLKKIRSETENLYAYTEEFVPEFRSTTTAFHVIFRNMNYDLHGANQVTGQVTGQVADDDNRIASLANFCALTRTRKEMQEFIGITSRDHFKKTFLIPMLDEGWLRMTIPDKPNSSKQKYIKV